LADLLLVVQFDRHPNVQFPWSQLGGYFLLADYFGDRA
jgi:hypothetical protein